MACDWVRANQAHALGISKEKMRRTELMIPIHTLSNNCSLSSQVRTPIHGMHFRLARMVGMHALREPCAVHMHVTIAIACIMCAHVFALRVERVMLTVESAARAELRKNFIAFCVISDGSVLTPLSQPSKHMYFAKIADMSTFNLVRTVLTRNTCCFA